MIFVPCTINSCNVTVHVQGKKKNLKTQTPTPNGIIELVLAAMGERGMMGFQFVGLGFSNGDDGFESFFQ